MQDSAAGVLVDRDGELVAQGMAAIFANAAKRTETRTYPEGFSGDETSKAR